MTPKYGLRGLEYRKLLWRSIYMNPCIVFLESAGELDQCVQPLSVLARISRGQIGRLSLNSLTHVPPGPQSRQATTDWQAGEWETCFSTCGIIYFSIVTLCLFIFIFSIWSGLFANAGTLSLTSNRIIFSNNLQSKALHRDRFDCTISNIRSYNNFLFPFPFFSLQKFKFTCFTKTDSPAELPGRKFSGGSFLQHLRLTQPLWDLISAAVTLYKKHPFISSLFACPKKTSSNADAHSNPIP